MMGAVTPATRRRLLGGLAAAVAAPAAAAQAKVHVVTIRRMAFGPMPAGVSPGDAIEWVNRDPVPHTATARDGRFDVDLPAGARKRAPVGKAGRAAVYCRYHPGMTAALTVG
ncbi:plastocyanin [Phenylobacterium zucineum HLK1]|uniref:Plastocyanin n=1 Tax=Phenylobacterium zucineum (strain HLK1) TaxID=450851 RepID=B4RD57_PHEZH|nr:cupredoxin domain-containing protein [Phenylobacterium zucineum]ACG76661.1 plastocyanin [Phenylobacterium zucineum HLK1]